LTSTAGLRDGGFRYISWWRHWDNVIYIVLLVLCILMDNECSRRFYFCSC